MTTVHVLWNVDREAKGLHEESRYFAAVQNGQLASAGRKAADGGRRCRANHDR
ncbi:hypothetical protein D3C87_1733770 [compost metagenome]